VAHSGTQLTAATETLAAYFQLTRITGCAVFEWILDGQFVMESTQNPRSGKSAESAAADERPRVG
jgi:hypothetical protein